MQTNYNFLEKLCRSDKVKRLLGTTTPVTVLKSFRADTTSFHLSSGFQAYLCVAKHTACSLNSDYKSHIHKQYFIQSEHIHT